MKPRAIAIMMAILSLAAGNVFASGIGIFSASDGSSCTATIPTFVQTPIYVIYVQGATQATGAEYRIDGMPGMVNTDYLATLIPAPNSNLNLGSAFDGTGHVVAWPAPQTFDGNGNLLLATYNMLLLNANAAVPASLQIVMRNPPTNIMFPCPLIVKPDFNLECQPAGNLRLNDAGNPCFVGVEEATWTGIRNLYR